MPSTGNAPSALVAGCWTVHHGPFGMMVFGF